MKETQGRFSLSQLPVSGWVLIVANLIPLVGVLAFDWSVFKVMILFWAENVVIGLVHVLRMLSAKQDHGSKLTLVPFFVVHYGIFTLGHGSIVMGLFGQAANVAEPNDFTSVLTVASTLFGSDYDLLLGFAALFISHLFSFGSNFIGQGLYQVSSPQKLFSQPYGRIIIMHVTVLVGGLAAEKLGSPVWALLVLISLKTWFDLQGHLAQNKPGSRVFGAIQ